VKLLFLFSFFRKQHPVCGLSLHFSYYQIDLSGAEAAKPWHMQLLIVAITSRHTESEKEIREDMGKEV